MATDERRSVWVVYTDNGYSQWCVDGIYDDELLARRASDAMGYGSVTEVVLNEAIR